MTPFDIVYRRPFVNSGPTPTPVDVIGVLLGRFFMEICVKVRWN